MTSVIGISTEIQSGMQHIPLELIDPNPWQPRIGEDHVHIKKIAESIAANGLLQVPSARRVGDRYQLAFGHSRLAAFKFLRDATDQGARFETMPLNIVELSDRQMADQAAAENVARKDLSAIEVARGIKRYIDDFGATQLEAGRVYGYTAQSSVSNLLRLLQLPEPVQQQVNEGKLPERHARELIALGTANASAAVQVAAKYIKAASDDGNEDDPRRSFDYLLRDAYDEHSVRFSDHATWDLSWPGKPIAIEAPKKDQPDSVSACKGCPFFVDNQNAYWRRCLKPACFNLKHDLWLQHALEAASKKLGVPIQTKDEKTEIAFNGVDNILPPAVAEKAISAKDATLRLAPFALKKGSYDYASNERKRVLGFSVIMLTTTDSKALCKALQIKEEKKTESSWERENRLRNERRKRNEKLCAMAAPHLACAIEVPEMLIPVLHETCEYLNNDERAKFEEKGIDARRADIMRMMLEKHTNADAYQDAPTEGELIKQINELARTLKLKLPNDWHHEAVAVSVNSKAKSSKKKG